MSTDFLAIIIIVIATCLPIAYHPRSYSRIIDTRLYRIWLTSYNDVGAGHSPSSMGYQSGSPRA